VGAERESQLLRLAEAVGDREPVEWGEQRVAAGDLEPVVEGLERLHALSAAFAAVEPSDRPGEQVPPLGRWGHLELLARLGEGSFGEVFRARDPSLDREVALKLRRAGPGTAGDSGRRLLEEARRLARVRHPNVVAVHGADLADGRVGIWTELVEGQTLEERLDVDGPMGAGEAVTVGLDLCRALASVHASGLVHGDVKAANVLRERGGRIVLTDLGSATEAGALAVTGSPATLAPEVLDGGPSTPSADLYSLGVLLYHLLTGRYPVDPKPAGSRGEAPGQGARVPLRDLRPDLPLELVRVIERAMEPEPDRRYGSAGALEQALAGLGGTPAVASPPAARATTRLRAAVIAGLAAAVLVAAAVTLALWRGNRAQDPPAAGAETTAAAAVAEPADLAPREVAGPAQVEPPPQPLPRPLAVRAALLRATDGGGETLADGDRVSPGDRLYLELEAAEPIHAWVVNEDLEGNLFVLFPIAGLDLANPLPAGTLHRLPGRHRGVPQEWQVTSAGGRERFLVIAARGPLPDVDRELQALAAANPAAGELTRGVGGIAPAPAAGRGRLDALAATLAARQREEGSTWLLHLELVNP